MDESIVTINRAPVLTLWAVIVAEHLGYDPDTALTLGKAVAGLNAQAKGRHLGIFIDMFDPPETEGREESKKAGLSEKLWVKVCGWTVPTKNTKHGVRAVTKDKPIDPQKVRSYLKNKFGESLKAVRKAMEELAAAFEPEGLEEAAYRLYEAFRPKIASGRRGWGQKGKLSLDLIRSLAARAQLYVRRA